MNKVVGVHYDGDTYCKSCYDRNEKLAVDMIMTRDEVGEAEAHAEVKENLEAFGGVIFEEDEFEFSLYCWECDEVIYEQEEDAE